MYRVPLDLDLHSMIGEFTTQLRVGQFDIQFSFGPINFQMFSSITLKKKSQVVGTWAKGRWPDATFYDIMNSPVAHWEIPNDRMILIQLANGIEIQLLDDSDQHECMSISFEGETEVTII